MPASHYNEWRAFFNIFPFTQDREDFRFAKLCAIIYNSSGKQFKKVVNADVFMPEYLDPKKKISFAARSLEDQQREFSGFMSKLRSMGARPKMKRTIK